MDQKEVSHKKERNSNIELLRIVAMFLVLIDHSGYMSIDPPTYDEVYSVPMLSFARYCSQSFSSICVNVFVLISGWFGIKMRKTRVYEFLFQCYFICFVVYFLLLVVEEILPMSMGQWIKFLVFDNLWFVKCFLILYLFSPMMNMLIDSLSQKQFFLFLMAFMTIQFLHGFVTQVTWFDRGMSPLTLMSLYMTGRYMRLYPNKFTSMNKWSDMSVYFVVSLIGAICTFISVRYGAEGYRFFSYASPTIIISSVYFFLFFTKISFQSRLVNWIAASAFSVYVLHCEPHSWIKYLSLNHSWWSNGDVIAYIYKTLSLNIIVFFFAVVLDKIRIVIWNHIKR